MPAKKHSKKTRRHRHRDPTEKAERKLRQKQKQNVIVNVGGGGGEKYPPVIMQPSSTPDMTHAFQALFSHLKSADERRYVNFAQDRPAIPLGHESSAKAPPAIAPSMPHATIETTPIISPSRLTPGLNYAPPANVVDQSQKGIGSDPTQPGFQLFGSHEKTPVHVMKETTKQGKISMNQIKKDFDAMKKQGKITEEEHKKFVSIKGDEKRGFFGELKAKEY